MGAEDRTRPWVMANMVMSADGSYSLSGKSGGLSGTADKEVFHELRALADVILVGAQTARAERYRRPASDQARREQRRAEGRPEYARLALVSGSGAFPSDQPFLDGDGPDPIVFVPEGAPLTADEMAAAGVPEAGIEIRRIAAATVEPAHVIDSLTADGARIVLCEGGPSLLGQMCAAGLLDQLFLTLAPKLAGGDHTGLLGRTAELGLDLDLVGGLEEQGYLMLNYHVRGTA